MSLSRSVTLLLLLVLVSSLRAQFVFEHFTTANGLPSDVVYSIHEDRHGYIWAGTETGLARLEGTRVRTFQHVRGDSTTLAHDQVNCLAEDVQGRLWLATMGGLSCYNEDHGTFRNFRILTDGNAAHQANRMLQVLCTGDSIVWVVSEQGIYRFHTRTSTFVDMEDRPAGAGPPGITHARCWLTEDKDRNGIWAATTEGLAFWDARTDRWTDHRNAPASERWAVRAAVQTPMLQGRDSLWYLDAKTYGICCYDLRTGRTLRFDSIDGRQNRFTMQWLSPDPNGGLWASLWTHRLFHRSAQGQWVEARPTANAPGTLRSGQVTATVRTRNGDRWFATDAGLAMLRTSSQAMRVVTLQGNSSRIQAVLPFGQDSALVGTVGDGVYALDMRTGSHANFRLDTLHTVNGSAHWPNQVYTMAMRDTASIRVINKQGIAVFDTRSRTYALDQRIMSQAPTGLGSGFTFAAEDEIGGTWLGSWSSGLFHIDERTGECIRVDTADGPYGRLPNGMALCWLRNAQDRCWLGLNEGGGLVRYVDGRFHVVRDAQGGNLGGVVRCMAQAPDGKLWLGTHEEGILVFDPTTNLSHWLNRRDGLPGIRIHAILFDKKGTAWVTTAQGIARRAEGAAGFRTVQLPTGLQQSSVGDALAEMPDGRILFGAGKYLVVLDPMLERVNTDPPQAVITTFRINDSIWFNEPHGRLAALEAGRKALTLELGATGTHGSTAPSFRYRLDQAAEWSMIGAAQRIDLFDLPTGDHRIEVEASANGVDWSLIPATVELEVLPPFWATWWFRSGAVVLVFACIFIGFRLYLRDRLRKERAFYEREQAVLTERVRIAGDMHDDLGAGLSALKLKSEMALRVEKDPLKREQLSGLAGTAGELIGSMRQIIWTMNQDQTSVEDLVVYTTSYARNYCEQNTLAIHVMAEGPWSTNQLSTEQRRNVFLVVKEALHNVVKHANATEVQVSMAWRDGLIVEIADNGVGLSRGAQGGQGNGLRNMEKRIKALGGSLVLNGRPEGGTSIRFQVTFAPTPNQGSIVVTSER